MADQFSRMYDVERVGGDQRTRLAEMLRANALNQPQGQMVSGWYVPPSWSQNLNQALQGGIGTYMGLQIDEENKAKTAELLRDLSLGKKVEPIPAVQNFNGMDQMAEGQTSMPQVAPQTALERITQRPQAGEQSQMAPAMRPQQEQRYVPWTEEEKLGKAMELAQRSPLAAQIWSAQDTAKQARALKLEDLIEKRAYEEKKDERERLQRREDKIFDTKLALGNRQPGAPIAVIGPNGQPMYVAPSQAYGMTPATEAKPLTEGQAKNSAFQSQMVGASNNLAKLQAEEGYDPTSYSAQAGTNMAGGWGNLITSGVSQRAKQAQDQWLESYLRFKTGAAAQAPEMEINRRTFFPVVGEKPDSVAQKAAARKQAEQDIGIAAGKGAGRGVQPTSSSSSSNW